MYDNLNVLGQSLLLPSGKVLAAYVALRLILPSPSTKKKCVLRS